MVSIIILENTKEKLESNILKYKACECLAKAELKFNRVSSLSYNNIGWWCNFQTKDEKYYWKTCLKMINNIVNIAAKHLCFKTINNHF